jgi:hypothetical protein
LSLYKSQGTKHKKKQVEKKRGKERDKNVKKKKLFFKGTASAVADSFPPPFLSALNVVIPPKVISYTDIIFY